MNRPHQRKGAISNAHVGRAFERVARRHLAEAGISTEPRFKIPVGIRNLKKLHEFDLGSSDPLIVVECKSHRWTEGDKVAECENGGMERSYVLFFLGSQRYQTNSICAAR